MKKLTLLLSALMIAGVTFAHDGKNCCKKGDCKDKKNCSKEAKAAPAKTADKPKA